MIVSPTAVWDLIIQVQHVIGVVSFGLVVRACVVAKNASSKIVAKRPERTRGRQRGSYKRLPSRPPLPPQRLRWCMWQANKWLVHPLPTWSTSPLILNNKLIYCFANWRHLFNFSSVVWPSYWTISFFMCHETCPTWGSTMAKHGQLGPSLSSI